MNRATMKKDRENQKRLLQEIERLSDDTLTISDDHHDLFTQHLHDIPLFSGTALFFSSELAASRDHCNQDNPLMMDLQNTTSHSPLSYESVTPCEQVSDTQQLQVDHNGTKVPQLPFSSAWLSTSDLTDVGTSVSVSTSSSSGEKSSGLSPACAAAAATAAMIVVPDDHAVKRPRSPLRDESIDDEGIEEGSTTEASLVDRPDPTSPRSISGFPKAETPHLDDLPRKEAVLQVTQKYLSPAPAPSRQLVRRVQPLPPRRLPVDVEERMVVTLSLDSARDPAVCRKRRAEAMERFRRKKAVRSFGRKVRYQIRKRIATTRPRVNGRFARRSDAENQAAKTGGK